MKQCTKCGVVKPLDAFRRASKERDGRAHSCKACDAAYRASNRDHIVGKAAAYYAANREAAKLYMTSYRAENRAAIAEAGKGYYAACRDSIRAQKAQYHAANRERIAAYRAANRDSILAQKAAYRAANAEKLVAYRAANRERDAAAKKVDRKANPDKYAAAKARRRAAELRATPAWANAEVVSSYYVLAAAMTKASGVPHHVDHVEPLQGRHVCGLHNEFNLQVLPKRDNITKGNRPSDVRAPAGIGPVPATVSASQAPALSKTSPVPKNA